MAAVRGMDTPGFSMRDDPAAGPSRQIMQDRQGSAKFAGIGGRVANLPGRLALEAVDIGAGGPGPDILTHDETDAVLAFLLAGMTGPDLPVAMGVLYADPAPQPAPAPHPAPPRFDTLVRKAQTWTVP